MDNKLWWELTKTVALGAVVVAISVVLATSPDPVLVIALACMTPGFVIQLLNLMHLYDCRRNHVPVTYVGRHE